jgi:pimeloyl-ACP methyl ester carboxylesterase
MPTSPLPTSLGKTITLRDGRTLGYTEYGVPNGKPVMFCHGTPGSRRFHHPDAAIATALGIRLIAADRPGYGLSTFQRGRRLLDWPDDLAQLADALGVDRFAVVGLSGGGPHTLACAYKLVGRLTRVGLVASTAPFDIPSATEGMAKDNQRYLAITRHAPFLALRVLYSWAVRAELRNPEAWLQSQSVQLAEADRAVRASAAWRQMELDNVREAYRQGALGHAWEGRLFTRPWGFRAQDIVAAVHLWQGEADTLVPVTMGRYLASAIPSCIPVFLPDVGHLSLFYNHWRDILAAMIV